MEDIKSLFLFVLCFVSIFTLGFCYEFKQKQETERFKLQLQIEMVKAGVTNIPQVELKEIPNNP